ncbi:MAG TPA: hypothetical protein PLK08_00225, partial [Phycisphaerae bacterium]|nr:hypothetical protein [Phycisphaerae bacterium]
VAATALASRGQFAAVKPLLEHLVKSGMTDVSTFASMTLLAHGDNAQVQYLRGILLDKQTQPELIISMLNQIRREKILAAMPVAQYAANSYDMLPVQIRGFMAIDAMAPNAADLLCDAIKLSRNLSLSINIMRMLASRDDSTKQLTELSSRNDIVGDMARFELARRSNASSAGVYLQKLLSLGHPIIVEYVYNRIESDLADKRNVDFYIAPLANYIQSRELSSTRITPMHTLLATGISVLGDMQRPAADKVLAEIFSRPDNDPLKQLAIVALYATPNRNVAAMAKPCLKSPYPDTKAYAAMLLAKFNDPAAIPALLEVQLARPTTEPDVMALVDWYLLRFAGNAKTTQAVETITRSLR